MTATSRADVTTPSGVVWGDARDDLWRRLTQAQRDAVVAEDQERVAHARESLPDFFSYVMREPTKHTALKCAPHQRVALDFVMRHDRSVLMLPIGTAKTMNSAATTLFLLGRDSTTRGAIVSATQGQAAKVLRPVSDYVQHSPHLRRVFPNLRKSRRLSDPWTQTMITVDRPPGIPDASLFAVGMDGGLPGSRLNWIVVDDLLNRENTSTKEARDKVYEWFDSSVLSRLDPVGAHLVVTNTTWHPDDLVHRLEKLGWATLRMDVYGDVRVQDDAEWMRQGRPQWEHPSLRPKTQDPMEESYRLRAHDPDPTNEEVLWPERYSREHIENVLRTQHLPGEFNRAYMMTCRDDGTSMCKQEYVDLCLRLARDAGHHAMASRYDGKNAVFTGVDLAIDRGETHDDTAFFTFEVLEDGMRRILDIEVGQWPGPEILDKLFRKQESYNSILVVESNACFVPGTRVLTIDGYVYIEDLAVGTLVWTHKGRWMPITKVHRGQGKILTRVRAKGGESVRCTPNHWFHMREAGRLPGRKGGHHRPVGEPAWVSAGFPDKPSYVGIAIPRWPVSVPTLHLRALRRRHNGIRSNARSIPVTEEIALLLGLFMAEGNATKAQSSLTLSWLEDHLAEFAIRVFSKLALGRIHRLRPGRGVQRITANDTALAELLMGFGKSRGKYPPIAWWGWSLNLRLAMVRGWLMGDGCLCWNNQKSTCPTNYFSGSSISRNWMLFARATLMEAGYRAVLRREPFRGSSVIEGRLVNRHQSWTLSLNADDTELLRQEMTTAVEDAHWPWPKRGMQRNSSAAVVLDEQGAWSPFRVEVGCPFEAYDGVVFNLEVEGDESYVVEDMVVHNAQAYIKQFAIQRNKSLPIKARMTGRGKHHPEHGIAGFFLELSNGGWLIPNDRRGRVHPMVQKLIDACLYYSPSKHTPDVLSAVYMAREQAREWGLLSPRKGGDQTNGKGSIQASLLAR